jgi:hypothetical protein
MFDVKQVLPLFENLWRKETRSSKSTNSRLSKLHQLALGYEPATVHEKKMPINIGRSAFLE